MTPLPEPDQSVESAANRAVLEISLETSLELCRLGLATMFDIRQTFELDMKGAMPGAVHVPLFEVKKLLGQTLTADEQEILDAGEPSEIDLHSFIRMVNQARPRPRPHRAVPVQQRPAQPVCGADAAFAGLPQSAVGGRRLSGLEEATTSGYRRCRHCRQIGCLTA